MEDVDISKSTILLVDDKPDNLKLLIQSLHSYNYCLNVATNGRDAVERAKQIVPDLILLDLMMPDISGYEVCDILKQQESTKNIPIIFLSGLSDIGNIIKGFEYGAIDYIAKPIRIEEVISKIKINLKLRKYQLLLEQKNNELNKTLTLLQSQQEKMIRQEKISGLGVLTAGITHEINNPINAIMMSTQALQNDMEHITNFMDFCNNIFKTIQDTSLKKKVEDYKNQVNLPDLKTEIHDLLHTIGEGCKRTADVVKYLKIYTGLGMEEKSLVDINENITLAITLLKNEYAQDFSIKTNFKQIPHITGVPGRLNQVFLNIIKNGIDWIKTKAVIEDDSITIGTDTQIVKDNHYVIITICNTGPQISADIIDKIFDPFFTTSDSTEHMGLGLSICQSIIKEHGGAIEVVSGTDCGAKFTIYLPIHSEEGTINE